MSTTPLKGLLFPFRLAALVALFAASAYAQANFVYTNNDVPGPNTVSGFSVDENGALTEIPGSPFSTGGTGAGGGFFASNRVTACAVGNFLYVSNTGSGDVSGFSIDPATGSLTPVPGSPFPAGGLVGGPGISLAVTSDGQFVIAANGGNQNIYVFLKGADGSLTAVEGSPFVAGVVPDGIKVSADGRFLAAADPTGAGVVAMFSIESTGALTPVAGSPFPDGGDGAAAGVDINCASNLLFAGEANPGTIVDVFNIAPDGALAPIPGSPFNPGVGVNSNVPLLSPDDRFLFVSNQGSNSVTVFSVAADGTLTVVPGSPFPVGGAAYATSGMATNQEGTLLYTASFDNWVGVFTIAADGTLTPVPGSPFSTGQLGGLLSLAAFPPKGCAPRVGLSATSLAFPDQRVGTTSPTQVVELTNVGGKVLNLDSIVVNDGDFQMVHTCPGSLAPRDDCELSVNFAPAAIGARTGDITITSNDADSPHTITLAGTGVGPFVEVSPTSLSFGNTPVGTPSTPQAVTLKNSGTAPLTITSIAITRDYSEEDGCGSSVAPGAECNINVTFTPTAPGTVSGTVIVSNDAPGGPRVVALSGKGTDYSIAVPQGEPTEKTVAAGQSAGFTVAITPISGFTGTVSVSCAEDIPAGTCSLSSSSVQLGDAVTITVTATTTARSMAPPATRMVPPRGSGRVRVLWLLWMMAFVLLAIVPAGLRGDRRAWAGVGITLLFVVLWTACGGAPEPGPRPPPPGTPAGTYQLTVTATSGALTRQTTLTLKVT